MKIIVRRRSKPALRVSTITPLARGGLGGGSSDLLTVAQVAKLLQISERHLRRLITDKKIVVIRIGRSIRISIAALQEFLVTCG